MVKKDKNKVKDIVDEFLKDKLDDTFHVDVKKKNLINDGLLDSLDILTLSSKNIKKFCPLMVEVCEQLWAYIFLKD